MKTYLIIAVHGFNALDLPWILIWKRAEQLYEELQQRDINVRLVKYGYKDILYHKNLDNTLKYIRINFPPDKFELILIGHSLGGFSVNRLAGELLERKYSIKILTQIDPLPILLHAPVYSDNWIPPEEVMNEAAKIKFEFNFRNLSLKINAEEIIEDIKFKLFEKDISDREQNIQEKVKILQEKIFESADEFMAGMQDLLDKIEANKLEPRFINDGNPLLHQQVYPEIKHHLYYYSAKESWDIFNRLVHLGTKVETGPIPDDRVKNVALCSNHVRIPGRKEIYDTIISILCTEVEETLDSPSN
ncbi:MAG: alpha/beta hydrolase [Candidatus Heimdallarchaeota archaeon]|nr:alpha/beta hydrolase [Candidatus Heimdallarchaeota archaeon]